jgi:NADH-quinone oxidoreductase subunit F
MGTQMREIIEEHAGGMLDGYGFRGVIPGGASTDFLVEEHLDVALDFDSVAKAGSRLGTGTMVVPIMPH